MKFFLSWCLPFLIYFPKKYSKIIFCDPLSEIEPRNGSEEFPFKSLDEVLTIDVEKLLTIIVVNNLILTKSINIFGRHIELRRLDLIHLQYLYNLFIFFLPFSKN